MSNDLDVEKVDLDLSQAIKQYDNWFEFFCLEYFGVECCKVLELDWIRSQLNKYRSGAGV